MFQPPIRHARSCILVLHPASIARATAEMSRMRKNKHSQSFVPEYSAKSVHCRLKLRYVHEHIVRDDDIKLRVAHGSKFNAGINPKIDTRMIGSGDFDHAVRKINSRNQGAPIAGLFRQITGTAAGVEHLATTHVAGKCPQHRVGIENAIAVSSRPTWMFQSSAIRFQKSRISSSSRLSIA
jgi:hypothetical protein